MRRSILALTAAIATLAPAWVLAGDQEMAQQVANNLRTSGKLKGYAIDVKATDGTVMLNGTVTSKEQMSTALKIANQTGGVEDVINNLSVSSGSGGAVALRQPGIPTSAMEQQPQQQQPVRQTAVRSGGGSGVPLGFAPATSLGGDGAVMAAAANCPTGPQGGQPIPAYAPGTGGGVAPATFDHPHMPNHAWPSYAAYPNYAAVTYPRQYSATAWPYIGPFYPYPQVPLGWRKVSLEWDDGWWFLEFDDRVHHHHRGAQCN